MKHITYGGKSLLVGDDVADALLDYAALLVGANKGDTVKVNALSSDGDVVVASFLLGPGTTMMAETTTNTLPEPDNVEAVEYVRGAIARLQARPSAALVEDEAFPDWDDVTR